MSLQALLPQVNFGNGYLQPFRHISSVLVMTYFKAYYVLFEEFANVYNLQISFSGLGMSGCIL